jgi:hypothetical protein
MRFDIARVKAAADISEIIGGYVNLKRRGSRYFGLCPFHNEKTPSFCVSAEPPRYKCFGCEASGDVFTFLQQIEGITFAEALQRVAEIAGVPPLQDAPPAERRRWAEALAAAPAAAQQVADWARAVSLFAERLKADLAWARNWAWESGATTLGDTLAEIIGAIPRTALDPAGNPVVAARAFLQASRENAAATIRMTEFGRADRVHAAACTWKIIECCALRGWDFRRTS